MNKTLLNKTMGWLAVCLVGMLLLAAPVFYHITTSYYSEDLREVMEQYQRTGHIDEKLDFALDVTVGMALQYAFIAIVFIVAVMITMRLATKRLWSPFDETLHKIERFRLGKDPAPQFSNTGISEFDRLNASLNDLIDRNMRSYRVQKEFTENASHELQTPIALIRADLDLLLQENLDERKSEIVNNMYDVTKRLQHLNRSLLLLAKIDNSQYEDKEKIEVCAFVEDLLPDYEKLYDIDIVLHKQGGLMINVNRLLLQIMINNLVINALRYSDGNDPVTIRLENHELSVMNHSEGAALDQDALFNRFNNPTLQQQGNGLGLAIVKQICEHYRWLIRYEYQVGNHTFTVTFDAHAVEI